jgi:hypothetical protein
MQHAVDTLAATRSQAEALRENSAKDSQQLLIKLPNAPEKQAGTESVSSPNLSPAPLVAHSEPEPPKAAPPPSILTTQAALPENKVVASDILATPLGKAGPSEKSNDKRHVGARIEISAKSDTNKVQAPEMGDEDASDEFGAADIQQQKVTNGP